MQLVLALKTDAQDRAGQNADQAWMLAAKASVRHLAQTRPTFTTDDVWDRLDTHYPAEQTHDPRAMGAVMRYFARKGVAEKTGNYTPSRRPECHARPVMVWRSMTCPATNDPTGEWPRLDGAA